jgi:hypothetical protein
MVAAVPKLSILTKLNNFIQAKIFKILKRIHAEQFNSHLSPANPTPNTNTNGSKVNLPETIKN